MLEQMIGGAKVGGYVPKPVTPPTKAEISFLTPSIFPAMQFTMNLTLQHFLNHSVLPVLTNVKRVLVVVF